MGKFINFLLALTLMCCTTVVISSCSSDDDEDTTKTEQKLPSIIGSWYYEDVTPGDYIDGTIRVTWVFENNGNAKQVVELIMNEVLMRSNTVNFKYVYTENCVKFTREDGSTFEYEVTIKGKSMLLGNEEDGYWNLQKVE